MTEIETMIASVSKNMIKSFQQFNLVHFIAHKTVTTWNSHDYVLWIWSQQNIHSKVLQSVYYVVVILPELEVITIHCLTVSADLHEKTLKNKQKKKTTLKE